MIKISLAYDFIIRYTAKHVYPKTAVATDLLTGVDHYCKRFNCTVLPRSGGLALKCSEEDMAIILLACPESVSYFVRDDK